MSAGMPEILAAAGNRIPLAPNLTLLPDGSSGLYLVAEGRADLHAVEVEGGVPAGRRRFLCSIAAGELFAGNPASCGGSGLAFLATGAPGTTVQEVCFPHGARRAAAEEGARLLDAFLSRISAALPDIPQPKQVEAHVGHDTHLHLPQGAHCSSREGVCWVGSTGGSFSFREREATLSLISCWFPLTPSTWLTAAEDSFVLTASTVDLLESGELLPALASFLETVLAILSADERERAAIDLQMLKRRTGMDAAAVRESAARFARLLEPGEIVEPGVFTDPLAAVFSVVCSRTGIDVDPSRISRCAAEGGAEGRVLAMARLAGVRCRRVTLEEGWWKRDCGNLIALTKEEGTPAALLARPGGGYRAYRPSCGEFETVNAEIASLFRFFAFLPYRGFADGAIGGKDLLRFGIAGVERDLWAVLLMGLCGSILGLSVPVVSGIVFDRVIPQAQHGQMWLLSLALLFCAVGTVLFELVKRIALLRVQTRMDLHVQGAVWDRMLKLPPPFFRQFSSADLADRSLGISAIRQSLSDTLAESLLSAVFSVTSLVLLFYYSVALAGTALAIALVAILILTFLGLLQVHYQKLLAGERGLLSGTVLEIVTCIGKFRVAGAEDRAFRRWGEAFFSLQRKVLKARGVYTLSRVFSETFPLIVAMSVFAAILSLSRSFPMTTGSFLAFSAAFSMFISALMNVSVGLVSLTGIVPYFERCKPIFASATETEGSRELPGRLRGDLEVSGVSFRYCEKFPPVLSDVQLRALPGDFVAVVGPSGSGKSTLARLLLGFEKPEKGCIFYDGKDLERLDLHQVRRQLGVVLQNGRLIAGDIFSNIVGSLNLTVEAAWEAARMAGLEEDIKAMPMGMHTFVSEGGGNLSGGQRQRLLIARALVGKPAVLIFDEATSALDNRTQAIVNRSLESLRVTRVVIAHRLSTIANADRIYVMERGRVVEQGSYRELMEAGGLFSELALRQVA